MPIKDTAQSMKEEIYGPVPNIPNLPGDLYIDVCAALNVEHDVNGDWRKVADELGLGDQITISNIQTWKSDECPANYVLRKILNKYRAEGSNEPVDDLERLFTDLKLHEPRRLVEQWKTDQREQAVANNRVGDGCATQKCATPALKSCA